MTAHFGLDIGSYSIKIIQAEKKGKEYKLTAWGEVRTPVSLDSESEQDKITLQETIKKLAADAKITTKNVVLGLPETEVFSQIIQLPPLSKAELASAISFEAEQYIPVPLEEVQLEYLVLKSPPKGAVNENMEVLLIAAKKKTLLKMVESVEKAGLVPLAVETEALSLVRNLENYSSNQAQFLIDFGHSSTDMMVIYKGVLQFIRTLNTGGEALTRAVAKNLKMEPLQAEQYKASYGIEEDQLEGKVAKAIMPTLSVILEEIKKGFAFFNQNNPDVKIANLILSGGGADMPGLSSYLAKTTNLEVLVLDAFNNFSKEEGFPKNMAKSRFSVAVGLALRNNG
jgi:type IV pilus assembly protein PilM